ncbi:MAG: LON peptidase substrate-binding domain-containing protein [Thermodesulfobacteriota bacterium]
MPVPNKIPLFPLGVVLLPEVLLPLHIFEERYKKMIGECLDKDQEFGVLYCNGAEMESKGCTARVVRVIKQYPDGRMDILTKGERRFLIQDLHEDKPYLEGSVEFFDDVEEPQAQNAEALATEGFDLMMQVEGIDGKQFAIEHGDLTGLKEASYLIASSEGFTPEQKKEFLDMTSTQERLETGVRSLRKILERSGLIGEIKKIVGGNGDAHKFAKRLKWGS